MTTPIREDMPISCEYCFFWHQSRCARGSDGCFYLMKIRRRIRQKAKCIDCPYGRDAPCLGWCTKEIMEYFRR